MTQSYWNAIQNHWARLGPPLCPPPEEIAQVKALMQGVSGGTLLLGVTPALAGIGADVTAVDLSETMVRAIWPGDTAVRRAFRGNWLKLPFGEAAFGTCVGDGSMNTLAYPGQVSALLNEVARVLKPGGRFICRLFARPAECESLTTVAEEALGGRIKSFHALKWRVAMAAVAARGEPNIPIIMILEEFDRLFPDRAALAKAGGWEMETIATIDAYRKAEGSYCFPTADEVLALVPEAFAARVEHSGAYELAECCPLLVMERA